MEFLKKEDIKIGVKFLSSGKNKRVCEVVAVSVQRGNLDYLKNLK
tara:strand:- start:685 stop:819 length:135 start_codon:yes stop_codon:yes gene_type:complete